MPRILVVGPAWVGDMVMAQSLFITLKNHFPESQIDILAPFWTFSLLERMPEVSDALTMSLGHGQFGFGERKKIGAGLIARNYQQAIILPNSWKSALVPFFAKIPRRTGYIGECRWGLLNDPRKLDKGLLKKTVERFVALGLEKNAQSSLSCPFPRLQIQKSNQVKVKQKFEIAQSGKILGMCPGAEYGSAKRWSPESYAAVARHYIDLGWQVWLFGSEKDQTVARQIKHKVHGACVDLSGITTMAEAVDLMSLTDCVLTNDSGLMHVAAALDKKIVAIYGSSDPGFTPPLTSKAEIIYLGLECSPCFQRECPLGHYHCLTDITVQRVIKTLDNLCTF